MSGALLMGGSALRFGSTVLTMGGVGGGGGGGGSTVPASALAAVPGTLMAWDATVPGNALAWNTGASLNIGAPLSQWAGAQVAAVANSISGQPRLRSVNGAGNSPNLSTAVPIIAEPRARVNGGVAGIGAQSGVTQAPGKPWPALDYRQSWVAESAVSLPAGQAWYIALAYSRPHLRTFDTQSVLLAHGNYDPASVPPMLLTVDSVRPSTATGPGAGTLKVLGTTVKTGIYPSHHGTVLLVNTPTGQPNPGLTVYLDNSTTPVNSTPITLPGNWPTTADYFSVCGIPQSDRGAECYLHECAIGGTTGGATTISSTQINAVMATLSARYRVGAAPTIMLVAVGQSNANRSEGNRRAVRPLLAYLTGALAFDWHSTNALAPGQGLWDARTPYTNSGNNNSYLTMWPGGTTAGSTTIIPDAANYTIGTNGTTLLTDLNRSDMPLYMRGCLAGVFVYHSEALSNLPYSDLGRHAAAWRNFAGKVRTTRAAGGLTPDAPNAIPSTASNFPFFYTELVAYFTGGEGNQMIHDSFASLESADGFRKSVPFSLDQSPDGDAHSTDASYTVAYTRGAYQLSRDVLSARGLDPSAVPSTISSLGPRISAALWEANTPPSVLVTVQHDAGNDLTLPAEALARGLGFTMRTNWAGPASRGTLVYATSAARVSATQIRVFFAGASSTLPGNSRLFYGEQGVNYGAAPQSGSGGGIGRLGIGNAVVDNAASRLPASHPIASDLGPGFALNMALRWTPAGVPIT